MVVNIELQGEIGHKEQALAALEAKVHRLYSILPDLRQKLHDRVQSGEAFNAERTPFFGPFDKYGTLNEK